MLLQMKRILVIDESEVMRETLALILGREFLVVKKPLSAGGLLFAEADENVDLLILGITPAVGADATGLLKYAARAPFAVLFLVDSKNTAKAIEERELVGCLAKPFNPYELREKVAKLVARRTLRPNVVPTFTAELDSISRYLEFPYLSRSASTLSRRFAATQLPLLITGEIGCGQERVARAIQALGEQATNVTLQAGEIGQEYLTQKSLERCWHQQETGVAPTLLIENLDQLSIAAQSSLLNFLCDEEARPGRWRYLATSRADLLEKVYQGEFLEALYYKLATLSLRLPALRDRREDMPALAAWFARLYVNRLGLGEVTFTAGAIERMSNYLWFGNLHEMETVIARTLTLCRKAIIDASDVVFDFTAQDEVGVAATTQFEEFVPAETPANTELKLVSTRPAIKNGLSATAGAGNGHAKSVDLNVVIHELAHELKNPMVTIKTFAQLLGDRYQDENFRARFQDVVGGDIERMDELLELMIEYADFSQPRASKVLLESTLRTVLDEISAECTKRQVRVHWKGNGYNREIRIDEKQLKYALKNVLLAALSQAKHGSEFEVAVEKQGSVAISYLRDGARVASISHYFSAAKPDTDDAVLPLRVLLAKQLVERNGGYLLVDQTDADRDVLRMEFPIA